MTVWLFDWLSISQSVRPSVRPLVSQSVSQSVCKSVSRSAGLSVRQSVSQSVSQRALLPSVLLTICLLVCLSVCLPACLLVCLLVYLSYVCLSACPSVRLPVSSYVWSIIDQPTCTFKTFRRLINRVSFTGYSVSFHQSTKTIFLLPASLFLTWSKSLHRCPLVPRTDKLSYQRRTKTQNLYQQSREDPGNSKNAHLRREYNKTKWLGTKRFYNE